MASSSPGEPPQSPTPRSATIRASTTGATRFKKRTRVGQALIDVPSRRLREHRNDLAHRRIVPPGSSPDRPGCRVSPRSANVRFSRRCHTPSPRSRSTPSACRARPWRRDPLKHRDRRTACFERVDHRDELGHVLLHPGQEQRLLGAHRSGSGDPGERGGGGDDRGAHFEQRGHVLRGSPRSHPPPGPRPEPRSRTMPRAWPREAASLRRSGPSPCAAPASERPSSRSPWRRSSLCSRHHPHSP